MALPAKLLSLLVCPHCMVSLSEAGSGLVCASCRKSYEVIDGIPVLMPELSKDVELSMKKWDEGYKEADPQELINGYKRLYFDDTVRQIQEYYIPRQGDSFLEIGCGPAVIGTYFAQRGVDVFGVDLSMNALKKARAHYRALGIDNAFFVCGCINRMPFKSECFNLVYGGGVIEHLNDTEGVVRELYRVLKAGGRSINAVPYLNLGCLLYRQMWGDIPNFPVLKQIAEFVHIRLLKARHMVFGYGLSFSAGFMKKVHKKAGFKDVVIGKWDAVLQFKIIPWQALKRFMSYLANNSRLFWPMIKVVGIK